MNVFILTAMRMGDKSKEKKNELNQNITMYNIYPKCKLLCIRKWPQSVRKIGKMFSAEIQSLFYFKMVIHAERCEEKLI